MVMLPSQGTSSGWRNGLTGTPGNSTSENAKPGTQGWTTPCTCTCWGLTNREWQKTAWESWGTLSWPWAAVCPWGKEDQKPPWLHQAEHYKRSREVILGAVSSAGLSGKRETWTYWVESTEEPLRWWRACSLNSGTGAFYIQEEQAWGRNLSLCTNIWWEGKDVGARLLFVVCSDRTEGDGQKLK